MENLKQMFLDNKIAVKCENQEEVNAIYEWICENVDKKYQRVDKIPCLSSRDKFPKYIFCCHKFNMVCEFNFDYDLDKQVIFRNGEFQYVKYKPKNNFQDYGFEADFEGEICFENHNGFYIGYINKPIGKLFKQWRKNDGNCFCMEGYYDRQYDLKPIKKEWYENPDNIGKIISINETLGIFKSYSKENETIIYIGLVDNQENIIHISKCRPATKEEVLSLLVEE